MAWYLLAVLLVQEPVAQTPGPEFEIVETGKPGSTAKAARSKITRSRANVQATDAKPIKIKGDKNRMRNVPKFSKPKQKASRSKKH